MKDISLKWTTLYEEWLKSPSLKDWTEETRGATWIFNQKFQKADVQQRYREKAKKWKVWFRDARTKEVSGNSYNARMKQCEPISDNQIRWLSSIHAITRLQLAPGLVEVCIEISMM